MHSDAHSDREGGTGKCGGLTVRVGQLNHLRVREGFLEEVTFSLDIER